MFPDLAKTLERHTEVSEPLVCWRWLGSHYIDCVTGLKEYGKVLLPVSEFGRTPKGKNREMSVNRAVCIVQLGRLLSNREVSLHSCDNKWCCNPAHLSAGSQRKNVREARERGLLKPQYAKRLDFVMAEEMRDRYAKGISNTYQLAIEYGISRSAVMNVIHMRVWRQPVEQRNRYNNGCLSSEDAIAIRAEYAAGGVSMAAIGLRYGVTATSISRVLSGKTHAPKEV